MPKGILGITLIGLLTLGMGAAGPAHADPLDEQKQNVEKQIAELQQSMEFLNADIIETATRLKTFQDQLPAAQQALAEANGKVQQATDEVNALAQRVALAQETRDKITEQITSDATQLEETKKMIGQIATNAYKQGGVPSDVSLMFSASGSMDLATSMDMADAALRTQNAALDKLSQQNATNLNSAQRLVAVEAEITALKAQADGALQREQAARDAAAAERARVETLVADTTALSAQLEAKKPVIQSQIAESEAAHAAVVADIAARQEQLRREAEAQRLREEAAARAAFEAEQQRLAAIAAAANKPAPPRQEFRPAPLGTSSWGLSQPVSAPISSGYGWRPTPLGTIDYGGRGGYVHAGIDFAAACGTPIKAAAAGEVWMAQFSGTSGNRVVVSHGVSNGRALATNYHHLTSFAVGAGQKVSKGQIIGFVGTTGNSTGCHLHFETVLDGATVNPLGLL